MSTAEFILTIVTALAWPAVVVAAVLTLRPSRKDHP
jgi:hypothetical protein